MNVSRPEDFHRSYAEAFNSGDVQSVVNLHEPNAVFVPQPDQVVSGRGDRGIAQTVPGPRTHTRRDALLHLSR
jgi:ketosteroid isomerase-like protein